MQDGETGHFDAEHDGGDAHFDVLVADLLAGLEGPGAGGEEADEDLQSFLV